MWFTSLFLLILSANTASKWTLTKLVDGDLTADTFKLVDFELPSLGEGDVHFQLENLSFDACVIEYLRGVDSGFFSFFDGIPGRDMKPGDTMITLASTYRIVNSNNADYPVGGLYTDTQVLKPVVSDMVISAEEMVKMIPLADTPDNRAYVGLGGVSGFTAVGSVNILVNPKAGEVAYVSAGAGALGLIVVQLLKLAGVTVIASAGSAEKVAFLEEIGVDYAFNYKTTPVDAALRTFAPEGLDVYYDNVGGPTLEAALNNMKQYGRMVFSGMISQYGKSTDEQYGVKSLTKIIDKSLSIQGFLAGQYPGNEWETFGESVSYLFGLVMEGKLKYQYTEYNWEQYNEAFVGLYEGKNVGKMVLKGMSHAGQEKQDL